MPRGSQTAFANMTFNAKDPRVAAAQAEAADHGTTLGTHLKRLVLALLEQGPLLLLQFREYSRVRMHLQQEAAQLEMPLDTYVLALLADRDRAFYEPGKRPAQLWFPRGVVMIEASSGTHSVGEVEEPDDDVNLDEAMQNAQDFLSDMTGFS